MSIRTWKTSEVITVEKCTKMYFDFKDNWNETGFNAFQQRHCSENGEDGVLERIFDEIGASNRYCIEFGGRDGTDVSNTLHFRAALGWSGLLLDSCYDNPSINLHKEFITAENINDLFHKYDAPSEPDLLSIDIDGNDLWVWRALTDFNPRVVIVETNQLIPPDEDRTIVYDPDRVWEYESRYFGASVFALYTVARSKGYSMIAVVDQNAIFLRDDDVERLQTDVPHVNDMARLFKPRLPRSYRNPETGEERTFSKLEIEGATLAQRLDMVGDWEPVMERSMRQEDPLDRLWTTSGLTEPE